ncbi:Polysaccharide biosynthesis protein [gamma proteobacterium HTCC5015]|nr:Polysaccharide biosynthesis protein [gamma proteobacterium HTCC5015]
MKSGRFQKLLPQSKFVRGISVLAGGSAGAQVLMVLASPVLTRLYAPEEFGFFGVYMGLSIVLSTIGSGRYELAILIPKLNSEAYQLYKLTHAVGILSFLLASTAALVISEVAPVVGKDVPKEMFFYSSAGMLVMLSFQTNIHWLTRQGAYKKISQFRMIQSLLIVSFSLVMAFWGEVEGLALAHIVGTAVTVVAMGVYVQKTLKDIKENSTLTSIAKEYIKFPKYLVPAHGLNRITAQMPVVLLGGIFGPAIAGYYSLSQRVVGAPTNIVSGSVAGVFKNEASKAISEGKGCKSEYMRSAKLLSAAFFVPFFVLVLGAPFLFGVIFGAEWRQAGVYAQILSPLYYFRFVFSPLHSVYMLTGNQAQELAWQIVLFFVALVSLCVGYFEFSVEETLLAYSLAFSMMFAVSGVSTYRYSLRASYAP